MLISQYDNDNNHRVRHWWNQFVHLARREELLVMLVIMSPAIAVLIGILLFVVLGL